MSEQLIIKNFGPIKSLDLDLRKVNILIGEQASGKSTVAKVLAVCRYFSYIVNFSNIDSTEFLQNEQLKKGLNSWGLSSYLSVNSEIKYTCNLYDFELKCEIIERNQINLNIEPIESNKVYEIVPFTRINGYGIFSELLFELKELKSDYFNSSKYNSRTDEILDIVNWSPNENFYRLNVKKVMDNPLYISTERSLQTLSYDKNLLVADAVQDNLKKNNRIVRGYNVEKQIEPLSLTFKNISGIAYVKKVNENEFYPLHFGASGYQSTIPIVLGIKFYNEFGKRIKTFIIEEPELNLFPKAQKSLMEFLVEQVNSYKHSLLLTTHSPYVLTSLDNLMFAHKVGNLADGKYADEVKEIVPKATWMDVNDVSVYCLKNGEAVSILDRKEVLIDKDYLDEVSDIIGHRFDKLLNIEIKHENSSI